MQFTPGTIYLADQRDLTETDQLNRWSTFNHGAYFDNERKPFGPLLTLNDEVLMPGQIANYRPGQNVWVVIIPVTGKVVYQISAGNELTVDVGQVYVKYVPAGDSFELCNTYEQDKINLLYIEFAAEGKQADPGIARLYEFDLEGKHGQLIHITARNVSSINNLPFTLHIGLFNGRGQTLYHMQDRENLFFAFAVAGAFELQGRLMHQRDGLALWDLHQADMEALSNNAVMLVMEIKKQ